MVKNIEENREVSQDEIGDKMEEYIRLLSQNLSYGDGYLCINLVTNMDSVTYVEWLQKMIELLKEKEEERAEEAKKGLEEKRRTGIYELKTFLMD